MSSDKKNKIDKKSDLDKISDLDIRAQRLDKSAALKKIRQVSKDHPENIIYCDHCLDELANDDFSTLDVVNVLNGTSVKISDEPECVNGSWRYRVSTQRMTVVIAFSSETSFVVVTAWRNKK
ncbi:MAG: hypothetical protein U1F66_09850 [bacterium]